MKKSLIIFIGIAYFFNFGLRAMETSLPAPEDFTYKGESVRPACIDKFSGDSSRFELIFLNTDPCQQTKRDYNQEKLKDGFIGYEPIDNESKGSYIYYKYLGKVHLQNFATPAYHLLHVEWSGGGTGHFSSLELVDLQGDTLRLVDTLDGGDRCNGGLSEVHFNEDVLIYKKSLTPLALYSLFQNSDVTKPSFSDCASCCVGKVRYRKGAINLFEFDTNILENLTGEPNSAQACFNENIKETIEAGKSMLTHDELKAFTVRVKERCSVKEVNRSPEGGGL